MFLFPYSFLIFAFFFFLFTTAALGEFEFPLYSAGCGGGRSQRYPYQILDFTFGERFRKNSNLF